MSKQLKALGLSAAFALVSGCTGSLDQERAEHLAAPDGRQVLHTSHASYSNFLSHVVIDDDGTPHTVDVAGHLLTRSLQHSGGDLNVAGSAYGRPLSVKGDVVIAGNLVTGSIVHAGGKVDVAQTGPRVLIRAKDDVTIGDLGAESIVMTRGSVTVTGRMGQNARILSLNDKVTVTGCYEANPPAGAKLCGPGQGPNPL